MSNVKTVEERKKEYFAYNTFKKSTADITMFFPIGQPPVGLAPEDIILTLQRIVDLLKGVTGLRLQDALTLECECARFDKTIVIGYSSGDYWRIDNTIGLSCDCLKAENGAITTCTHELVHPFFKIFFYKSVSLRKKDKNEDWGDGFCDFLRIFIIDFIMNTSSINLKEIKDQENGTQYNWREESFEEYMRCTEKTGDHWEGYHKLALRLLNEFRMYMKTHDDPEKGEFGALKGFLQVLSQKEDLENEVTEIYHSIL